MDLNSRTSTCWIVEQVKKNIHGGKRERKEMCGDSHAMPSLNKPYSFSVHCLHCSCIRGFGCDGCGFFLFENAGQLEPSGGPNRRFWVKKTGLTVQQCC